jgi:hypothetical protein
MLDDRAYDSVSGIGDLENISKSYLSRAFDTFQAARRRKAWAIEGVGATDDVMGPFLTLRRGRSYVLAIHSHTA